MTGLKIYINPGHGGYDGANDRNVVTIPFAANDTLGFWESKSNLIKGLYLRDILQAQGATVMMSRTLNRDQDDRALSSIVAEANAFQPDGFLSIHSNAVAGTNTGTNHLVFMFSGTTAAPVRPESKTFATHIFPFLLDNQITVWNETYLNVVGDESYMGFKLGVLNNLNYKSFLSEGSFHDYQPETHRLLNKDYCRLEAIRFYQGFHSYFGRDLPNKGTVAGWVKSENERIYHSTYRYRTGSVDQWLPLNGATVELLDAAGTTVLDTYIVDNWYNGVFAFYDLTPGNYKLRFSKPDYTEKTVNVTVAAGKIAYAKVQLFNHEIFQITSPTPNDNNIPLTPTFIWDEVQAATDYKLEIAANDLFSTLVYSVNVKTNSHKIPEKTLVMGTSYFARITATSGSTQVVSPTISFSVMEMSVPTPQIISPANGSELPGKTLVVSWKEQVAKGFRVELSPEASFPLRGTQLKTLGAYVFSVQYDNLNAGEYYLRMAGQTSSGLSPYSETMKVTMGTTDIDKIVSQSLDAYAANGNLIIRSERSEPLTVSVCDFMGRLLSVSHYSLQAGENILPLNTNKLSKGVYLIRLQTAEKSLILKIY